MKAIKSNRIIQILYPLLVYYVLYNLLYAVFAMLFEENTSHLFCLMLAGLFTIVPEYIIYTKVPKFINTQKYSNKISIFKDALRVIAVVVIGLLLNIFITRLSIIDVSDSYKNISQGLYSGSLPVKIACNALVIPVLEELLYRGIIAGQIYLWHKSFFAILISAFCFGIFHFNIVQFLYAFIVGLFLGLLFIKTRRLSTCILAHGLINLIVIITSVS